LITLEIFFSYPQLPYIISICISLELSFPLLHEKYFEFPPFPNFKSSKMQITAILPLLVATISLCAASPLPGQGTLTRKQWHSWDKTHQFPPEPREYMSSVLTTSIGGGDVGGKTTPYDIGRREGSRPPPGQGMSIAK
jgi:hypothetical protein